MAAIGAIKQRNQSVDATEISLRGVFSRQHAAEIAEDIQAFALGLEVKATGALIRRTFRHKLRVDVQPPFAGEPPCELSVWKRPQLPDDRHRDRRLLDQLDHWIGDRTFLTVETDNETRRHEHACLVDLVDAVADAAARILLLAHRNQRVGIGAFDTHKNDEEIRFLQHPDQFVVVGEIERRFRRKLERKIVLLLPFFKVRKESLDCFFVADQVVVDEIDVAAIT